MNKELLEIIANMIERLAVIELHTGKSEGILIDKHTLLDIQKELELKALNDSESNKALEYLENMIDTFLVENKNKIEVSKANNYDCELLEERRKDLESHKQALIKAREQEKVLKIIKKKCLYTDNLNYVAVCINYDMYKEKMSKKHDTEVVKINWNDKEILDYLKLLKKEEFDLLKRWQNE